MGSRRDRASNRQQRRSERRRDDQNLLDQAMMSPRPARRSEKEVVPLTEAQSVYDHSISTNILTISHGPWGTGKTWWAAMRAAKALQAREVERIIITRPAQNADEELGFLPGELNEKYEPYFRPVRDALVEFLGAGPLEYHLKSGTIEARPLGLLRGATFKDAFVMLDEAQNATPNQMKLFLSRIGENCKVVIDGDLNQKDIPGPSGLEDILRRLDGKPDVGVVEFEVEDIVRSGFSRMIAYAYL